MKNTLTAETSAQKNFSWPRPNGCWASGPRRPRTSPTLSSTWLATSATEWMVSANSVGEPVTAQPKALAAAMAVFVAMEIETEEDIVPRYRCIGCVPLACALLTCPLTCHSRAYLPAAQNNPLQTGETLEPDRATRVELVGRDSDLRAEPVFEAVGKARRRIDHHRARIDLAQEAHGIAVVPGDDGVSVLRAVTGDVLDRGIERGDGAHREDRAEILGAPIVFRRRLHRRHDRPGAGIAAKLDTLGGVDLRQRRQNARRDSLVDEQRLHRV